jgi:hypothetical protein
VKQGQIEITVPKQKPIIVIDGDSAHLTSFQGTVRKNMREDQTAELLLVASATTQPLDKHGDLLTFYNLTT